MKIVAAVCILVFAFSSSVDAAGGFDDLCHLMTVSDLNSDNPKEAQLDIPTGCTSGDVDWHYPKGDLRLTLTLANAKQYQFCLEESWATMIGGIMDVTGGRRQKLSLLSKDTPTCVTSIHGNVQLLLTSEDTQYYMTTFKYAIKT